MLYGFTSARSAHYRYFELQPEAVAARQARGVASRFTSSGPPSRGGLPGEVSPSPAQGRRPRGLGGTGAGGRDDEGGVEPPIALFEDEALLEPLLLGILALSIRSRRV